MKQAQPEKNRKTLSQNSSVEGLPRKRGRPKDAERRARIVSKARELFLEHGFQVVSVDSIASAANVSNRTVFSHFPSKEDLLWAIVQDEGEVARPQIPEALPTSVRQLHDGLVAFGIGLVGLLTSPAIVRLGLLILSEASRHPDLAKTFYQWGPLATRRTLGRWIEHAKSSGWLSERTPLHAGDHLLALWQGCWHLPQQLGLEGKLSQRQVESHVRECVDLFMRAYR